MFSRMVPIVLSLMLVPCPLSAEGIASPRTKWAFQTEGPIRGGAVVSGDTVYFGSADGNLYAVDKADGRLRWSFATGGASISAMRSGPPVRRVQAASTS